MAAAPIRIVSEHQRSGCRGNVKLEADVGVDEPEAPVEAVRVRSSSVRGELNERRPEVACGLFYNPPHETSSDPGRTLRARDTDRFHKEPSASPPRHSRDERELQRADDRVGVVDGYKQVVPRIADNPIERRPVRRLVLITRRITAASTDRVVREKPHDRPQVISMRASYKHRGSGSLDRYRQIQFIEHSQFSRYYD